MKSEFMDDYLSESEDYPRTPLDTFLPLGVLWVYVSNSFLDGLINWTKIQKAFVLDRYTRWNEVLDDQAVQETKAERFARLTTRPLMHSKLDTAFQDDVLLLCTADREDSSEGKTLYVFMWYDRDCSDCMIGRFLTSDAPDVVIQKFEEYVHDWNRDDMHGLHHVGDIGPREIPLTYFKGWLQS